MASYHHHCHPGAVVGAGSVPDATALGYCYCCHTDYHQCHNPLPQPAPPPPLLPHSHLRHLYTSQLKQSYTRHIPPHFSNHHSQFQEPYFREEEEETQKAISSLLRRVTALELSLRCRSLSSSSQSIRHAAARTIQTHFRAFLVRRSKTLRQLKTLASIKSTLNTIKSSISENTSFDCEDLSQKATSLLLKLNCIQGEDPMIRDAKRSIHRELIKIFDFIDGFYGKRREVLSSRIVKNVRCRGNGNKSRVLHSDGEISNVEKLRGLVEKIDKLSLKFDVDEGNEAENPSVSMVKKHGISQNRRGCLVNQRGGCQTKAKKSVSFAENGKVNRVLKRIQESLAEECDGSIEGDDCVDEVREVDYYPHREGEEVGVTAKHAGYGDDDDDEDEEEEEDQLENGDSQFSINAERGSRKILGQR